ncbi:MAG: hypothetical protein ACP5G4_05920 [bacterium]
MAVLAGLSYGTLDTTFALRLYELGLYEEARFEFERIDNPEIDEIDLYIARCHIESGELNNSIIKLNLIIDNTRDYDILKSAAIDLAAIELYRGYPNRAVDCIERAMARGAEIPLDNLLFIKKIADSNWRDIGIEIPNRKSPELARWMSLILPGSGQFYAGDLGNGLKSLGINSALWFVIVSGIEGGYYARAFSAFFFLAPRYWLGATDKSAEIAYEYSLQEYLKASRQAARELEW